MIRRSVTLPQLGLIAGTRAAFGAGVGLLIADRLNDDRRKAIGWTLLLVGALSTIPLAAHFLFGQESSRRQRKFGPEASDEERLASPLSV